jgi:hypothetical protein
MANAQRGGAGRITGAAVGDQKGVLVEDRSQNRLKMSGGHRRQHGTDGGAGAVGGHEDRNLLIRQSALGRLAAPSASLAMPIEFTQRPSRD